LNFSKGICLEIAMENIRNWEHWKMPFSEHFVKPPETSAPLASGWISQFFII
jgi:hypothetical protein